MLTRKLVILFCGSLLAILLPFMLIASESSQGANFHILQFETNKMEDKELSLLLGEATMEELNLNEEGLDVGTQEENRTKFVLEDTATKDQVIYWQSYHRPPGIILKGSDAGHGFVQLLLNQIIQEMPDYQHRKPMSTLARALEDMKRGKNVCHPSLMTNPEREKFIAFSQSSLFNPANYVITRAELAQQIQPQPADIRELVHNSQFTFVTIKGRVFGKHIDKYLAELPSDRSVKIASNSLSVMFRLIALGRIDATVAYPFEFEYFTQYEANLKYSLALMPVADMPRFNHGSIGCAKTPWDEKVIAEIDKVLTRIKPTDAYQRALTRWWPESILDEDFKAYYRNSFLNR